MGGSLFPQISVVVVLQCGSKAFRLALARLRAQSVASALECIIVAPSRKELNLAPEELEGFFTHRILELGPLEGEGAAKAAGVAAARAPLVAFMEDHSYPDPCWAEALIEAHRRGDFAAVGPVMLNANPGSAVSWGCFLVFYGPWMAARPQQEVRHLPANQSCYRRDVLLEYGSRLSEMLQSESVLHWDLLARNQRLHQEPAARVYHLNYSRYGPMLFEYYLSSRVFAANRARAWGIPRRIVYALGSPLIPLIRWRRIVQDAARAALPARILRRAFPALALALVAGAAGEALGYAFGDRRAAERLMRFVRNRHTTFTPRDLEALSGL